MSLTGNVFLGNFCPMCGEIMKVTKKGVCKTCEEKLPYLNMPYCMKCAKPLLENDMFCKECKEEKRSFDRVLCVYEHTDMAKKSIYDFKFENRRKNAEWYAGEIKNRFYEYLMTLNPEVIIPVPMHIKDKRKRGYNQSEVLSAEVGKLLNIKVDNNFLLKTIRTKAQKDLDKNMRLLNLKKSLEINTVPSFLERVIKKEFKKEYKKVILIDDIYTTGSTAQACSDVMKKAGVEDVTVICISRGVIN